MSPGFRYICGNIYYLDASLSVVLRQVLVFREIRIISEEDELWFSDLGAGFIRSQSALFDFSRLPKDMVLETGGTFSSFSKRVGKHTIFNLNM